MKEVWYMFATFLLLQCGYVATASNRILENLNRIHSKTPEDDQAEAVAGLIERLIPKYAAAFVLVVNKTHFSLKNNMDAFEYETSGGQVHVTGTSGVALASGVYHYLKYYCKVHVSWSGNQLHMPAALPNVRSKVTKVFSDRFRYYQNVCTASYSFAFWDWTRWEKEIDWMALQGINLPLAFNGQESIWRMVYEAMGLTEDELNEHFSGPAFLAWQRMGNLDGWGGPLSPTWHSSQLFLQHAILKRMRSFGMTPVLPGFAGHIPKALVTRLFPNAKYTNSSVWVGFGGKYRTALLDPMDPLFTKVGTAFIKKQIEVYNSTDHVYNADVFNEMQPPSSDPKYISSLSAALFATLEAGDPNAIWLMQGWQFLSSFWKDDLMQAWFSAVPLGRLVILDLASELLPIYTRTKGYFGHPFIWCMIENFGGNTRMFGPSQTVIDGLQSARVKYPDQLIGIGTTPEGINQNHINFELLYEMSWRGNEHMFRIDWMQQYVMRRYNDKYGLVLQGWNMIFKEVYNGQVYNGGGSQGRVTVTRPYVTDKLPTILWYDPKDVMNGWKLLIDAAKSLTMTDTLRHDLAKIGTQVIEDLMTAVYKQLIDAYKSQSLSDLTKYGTQLYSMFQDMDLLLASDRYSLLGNWTESSKLFGVNDLEKELLQYNARNQITLWGPDGEIEDYANKNWAGLVRTYYAQRWQLFIWELLECVEQKRTYDDSVFKARLMEFEKLWCGGKAVFPVEPTGDTLAISEGLSKKYAQMYLYNADVIEDVWWSARKRTEEMVEAGAFQEFIKKRYGMK